MQKQWSFEAGIKHISRLIFIWNQVHNKIGVNCNFMFCTWSTYPFFRYFTKSDWCRCNFSLPPNRDNISLSRNHLSAPKPAPDPAHALAGLPTAKNHASLAVSYHGVHFSAGNLRASLPSSPRVPVAATVWWGCIIASRFADAHHDPGPGAGQSLPAQTVDVVARQEQVVMR